MRPSLTRLIAAILIPYAILSPAHAETSAILVQSTTSTANSGLFDFILPQVEADTGIRVNVVAVGTGQAIKNAGNCDGDVLLVHAKAAEDAFVTSGYGVQRFDLMYNDFIVVGPAADPAGVASMTDVTVAFGQIAASSSLFASRGDDSGTHKKEQALWQAAGIDISAASGTWYRATGSGMGATLNAGVAMGAYVLTDRATWISFGNKADFAIHVQGDKDLFNQYGVILVNPEKCPNVKVTEGQAVIDWLLSAPGQARIAAFEIDGHKLFFPNAN